MTTDPGSTKVHSTTVYEIGRSTPTKVHRNTHCRRPRADQSSRLCGNCCHWRGALGVQSILQNPRHKHIDDTAAGAVVTATGYNVRHQLESTACESPTDFDCCVVSLADSVGLQVDDLSFGFAYCGDFRAFRSTDGSENLCIRFGIDGLGQGIAFRFLDRGFCIELGNRHAPLGVHDPG